jgi:hypothetical protein
MSINERSWLRSGGSAFSKCWLTCRASARGTGTNEMRRARAALATRNEQRIAVVVTDQYDAADRRKVNDLVAEESEL